MRKKPYTIHHNFQESILASIKQKISALIREIEECRNINLSSNNFINPILMGLEIHTLMVKQLQYLLEICGKEPTVVWICNN